jgi:hypothetical protein
VSGSTDLRKCIRLLCEQSQDIQYTIADGQIQIMDDKSVARVTGQGNCGKYVSDHPVCD